MKDSILQFVNGVIVRIENPTTIPPWIFRYDRVCLSVLDTKDIGTYWFKHCLDPLCKAIANPGSGPLYSITSPRSSHNDYYKVKRLESSTELIQIYYDPKLQYKPLASIEFSVPDKVNGYANHVKAMLKVEEVLDYYQIGHHVGSVEMALDCGDIDQYEEMFRHSILKYLRKDDDFWFNGKKDPTSGKPIAQRGSDPNGTHKYQKGRKSPVSLICYKKEGRMRLELTFDRSFFKNKKLDHFSEVISAGPGLFFNRLDLFEIDLKKIMDCREKSERIGTNPGLVAMGTTVLRNLFEKSSGEIVLALSSLLNWKASRVKARFGRKVEFPPFIIEIDE